MKSRSKFRTPAYRQRRLGFAFPQLEVLEDRLQPGSILLGQEWAFLGSNLMEPYRAPAVSAGTEARHLRPLDEQTRPSVIPSAAVFSSGEQRTDYHAAPPAALSDYVQSSAQQLANEWLALNIAAQHRTAAGAAHPIGNRTLSVQQLSPVQAAVPLISRQAELSAFPAHHTGQQQINTHATQNWATYVTNTPTSATGRSVAVASNGNAYMTGSTDEGTAKKAFVAAYDPSGNQLFFTTFQAQDVSTAVPFNHTEGHAIALDGSGNVYVTGTATNSKTRLQDAFVMRFDGSGNVDPTYGVAFDSGGIGNVSGNGIAVTPDGTATIVGNARFLQNDIFIASIAPDGSVLESQTHAFAPGSFVDPQGQQVFRATFGNGIALSPDGTVAYISGTGSTIGGDNDVMVMYVDMATGGIQTAGFSYASNPGDDTGNGIVVSASNGTVYQTGTQTIQGNTHAIAINWSADLSTTLYGVYDADTTTGTGIHVDPAGNVYLTGTAPDLLGVPRALVDELDPIAQIADTQLIADNGSGQEAGYGIVFSNSTVFVTGYTTSTNLATDATSLNGTQDAFLANVGGFLN